MFQMCISYDEINSLYVYLQRVKHLYGTCRVYLLPEKKEEAAQCTVCGVFIENTLSLLVKLLNAWRTMCK